MREIEIKLLLEPRRRNALLRTALLRGAVRHRQALLAVYFDTPDGDLAARHMALRLRREGEGWVQALKAGESGAAGLHARGEWEFESEGPVLDLARFRETPLAQLPEANRLHERLVESFRVEVTRTTWMLGREAQAVEVALDAGEVRAANGADPVLEVEIEGKGGDAGAVFDFASALVGAVPMRPSAVTKAERGHRLLHGWKPRPVHARPGTLDASMSPPASARSAVAAALAQLQANEEGVLQASDPEFVHQLRVALRRLRSALRAHRRALEPGFQAALRADLRWITRVAGEARDVDVLATQTLPAMARDGAPVEADAGFVARLEQRRSRARSRLRSALQSSRYGLLLLALARWLHAPPEHAPRHGSDLRKFARKALAKRQREVLDAGRGLDVHDVVARHRLRIAAKKLRYALQGFAPLWPAERVQPFLEVLSAMQDDLGRANDAAVATRLLDSLRAPLPLATFARGWLAGEVDAAARPLAHHLRELAHAKGCWRVKG